MSQKPVDEARALEALKRTQPAPDLKQRIVSNFTKPTKRPASRLPIGLVTASAVTIILLWPHKAESTVLAQSIQETLSSPYLIRRSTFKDGTLALIEYRSGNRRAMVLYNPKGQPVCESRGNGTLRVHYFDFWGLHNPHPNPNVHPYANMTQDWPLSRRYGDLPYDSIDKILGDRNVMSDPPQDDPQNSSLEVHRVHQSKPFKMDAQYVVEKTTRRIIEIRDKDGHRSSNIEYPASIPDSVFAPKLQVVKGVETFDLTTLKTIASRRVKNGIVVKNGITVRLVLLDSLGSLWTLWTGSEVDSQLRHPVRYPEIKTGSPYGLAQFTNSPKAPRKPGVIHLSGMGREALSKVGDTVTVDIPTAKGPVRFQNLPVLRIGWFNDVESVLGVSRS